MQGLAYANVVWFAQTAQQILFGLIFMSTSQLSFRDITRNLGEQNAEQAEQAPVQAEPEQSTSASAAGRAV